MIMAKNKENTSERFPVRSFIILLFFFSGVCGLVYEIAWLRVMGIVFGNTTFATSTVLAGYMAGLGLGALYFGKRIDQKGNPILLYGILEGGVAVYAVLTPLIWKLIEFIHVSFYRIFQPSFLIASLFMFAVAFVALFIPTFLMGGTLPVISKYFVKTRQDTAKNIGLLYGLNTAGAVVGVFLSGFFLLKIIGVWQTVISVAFLNSLIFVSCYFLSRKTDNTDVKESGTSEFASQKNRGPNQTPTMNPRTALILLILFGLSGSVSMMYEVGWTRVLAIVLGSSIYAFSIMLLTFLLGISAGSYLFSWISKYFRPDLLTFALLQMLTALFVLMGLNQFDQMPYYFVQVFKWSHGLVWPIEFGKFLLCSLVMFPPTLCIGALFACFIHIYRQTDRLGHDVGTAYFSNTIGTILGSALTGFLIIPLIGIQTTLIAGAVINAAIGIITFLLLKTNFEWKRLSIGASFLSLIIIFGAFVKPWDTSVITGHAAIQPQKAIGISKKDFFDSMKTKTRLFYKEGSSATVTVVRNNDYIALSVNGKVDASSGDAFTQYLLGHLPMLLNPGAKKVLVIGLGSASTAAAVASYPVETIDVIELEKAVVDAAKYFSVLNRNVLKDPRLHLHINDGRNYILIQPKTYDVIISEPSNPWIAGVANLFSHEHYENMSKRLNPGGVVCQWMHIYAMSTDDLKMVIRTFSDVFKNVSLWTSTGPDLMLIGSNDIKPIDFNYIKSQFKKSEVLNDFYPYGISEPEGFYSCFWLSDGELRELAKNARTNSDNYPYLEFSAPLNLFKETTKTNIALLNSVRKSIYPETINLNPGPEKNAKFHGLVARGLIEKFMYPQAQIELNIAKAIDPNDPYYLQVQGILEYEFSKFSEAKNNLVKAIEANPELDDTHYFLGLIYEKEKHFTGALVELKEANRIRKNYPKYLLAMGNILVAANQSGAALKVYTDALSVTNEPYNFYQKIELIYEQMASVPQQIQILRTIIDQYPKSKPAYFKLGSLMEKIKGYPQALTIYQAYLKQYPEDAVGYLNLARTYGEMGKIKQARKSLQTAIRINPGIEKTPQIQKFKNILATLGKKRSESN
ncbi:MAG: hypothetical protein A3G33_04860 [Omnitrophica bacterium RIFCSPLOWO2_12_FULL_44_17]|uniref:Polyamine aminopropyltransferase n=1 Tax=Candidatus Danuiimicrobium aquiferis TaxID=1801832 RepID=A0A1G1KQR5_9BACT|nr:MAG: hypothetical protein A3B72_11075 [Omnitrophica bacterium RIFCSPHIGHO2_02_FULL_45_28]OGW88614.1 MAG: hypothetical protein A3E74_06500 [Omnitrophica bacterium RIFCSPHIGHO2_12_FULL_44_12]OGW95261.1 MAG: hypothetical protein A3G33_04860 [Omnitrophica bacterium RIFCSPLOWO2_12_FULL_44_17]OGX02356.1 MAG: hypothetical protein A3J12_10195 [Omnitrophica bacterium RIFCSPLOWO2_02_FULL_44_11]